MRRVSAAIAAAAAVAALAAPGAAGDSAVRVEPAVGDPDTAFHVEVTASFPIRQFRDRYWFVLHGAGGRKCEGVVTNRVGVTPPIRRIGDFSVRVLDPNSPSHPSAG